MTKRTMSIGMVLLNKYKNERNEIQDKNAQVFFAEVKESLIPSGCMHIPSSIKPFLLGHRPITGGTMTELAYHLDSIKEVGNLPYTKTLRY